MKPFRAEDHFESNARLGIPTPDLKRDWDEMTEEEQAEIIYFWETVRGRIPDRIFALEREINVLQQQLNEEERFDKVIELTWDIADRASRINDLQIFFRLNDNVAVKAHH